MQKLFLYLEKAATHVTAKAVYATLAATYFAGFMVHNFDVLYLCVSLGYCTMLGVKH